MPFDLQLPINCRQLQHRCRCFAQTQAMGRAVAVLYNATEDQHCLKLELSGPAGGPALKTWLYQTCTELMAQEQPFFPARGAPSDMFWDQGMSPSLLHPIRYMHMHCALD